MTTIYAAWCMKHNIRPKQIKILPMASFPRPAHYFRVVIVAATFFATESGSGA
jgi:hypothetical protein